MSEKIIEVNMAKQSNSDLTAYAIYVTRFRSIPDIRDGLKSVIRRILWCIAHDFKGQGFVKTSALTGEVIKRYNPHGDTSVLMAIRNMINDFSTKYPTMDGSGSWGHKANPTPSAARYTECKISQFGLDIFIQDIFDDKRSTDWQNNYDNKCKEPCYLPAKIPTLLILGQLGIAVGIKCAIPSHNLGEVIDTTIKLIRDPNAPFCLIPDECMPCEIMETDFQKINDTGMGTYISQGIVDIGEYKNHPALYVRSLPDFTFFDSIKDKILELIDKGKMPYISDMISRSKVDIKTGKTTFEEIIVLKKGTDPRFVREELYTNTAIRQTRQVKLLVINNNRLQALNYREYLLEFIKFRRMTIVRKFNAKLQTYKTIVHERQLYLKLMTSGEIDKIIDMIKKQDTRDDTILVEYLINKLKVTPLQARFLLNTDIRRLSKGYLKKYQEELKVYNEEINKIMTLLTDPKNIDNYIINEMLEIKRKYNDKRLCRIISKSEANGIAPGTFKLIFTKKNFVKKVGENDTIGSISNDEVNFIITADNTENIFVFSAMGKIYKIPVHKIPISDKRSNGVSIAIINKYCTSDICCVARETTLQKLASSKAFNNFMYVISRNGFLKKMDIDDVLTASTSGIVYSKLDQGDHVQSILFGPTRMELMIYLNNKILRIPAKEAPYLKRFTKGNRVGTGRVHIDGMGFLTKDDDIAVILTKNGFVNIMRIEFIQPTTRFKAGTKVTTLGKDDEILSVFICKHTEKLVIQEGKNTLEFPLQTLLENKNMTSVSRGVQVCKNPTRATIIS